MAAREVSGPHREGDEPKPMMHGDEGSDSAIVAVKRTNEAGRPAEEFVEPRAGAQENAEQDGTPRTPSRQGASHGLDRVRQTARLKKEERFTALLHHIDADQLREAYFALKREAAPGVDGVTWEDYGHDLEVRLEDLHGQSTGEPTGRNRRGVGISRSPTGGSARSASPRWRTRSSSARWSRC